MSNKILVTYATKYGSTGEVATAIAEALHTDGFAVTLRPIQEVQTLDDYQAVVLGAPLYIGKWPKDAHRFLAEHREALRQRPVAVFALGPIHEEDEQEMERAREQLGAELAKYPWLSAVAVEMFVGKYDPTRLNFAHKVLAILPGSPLHGLPASDYRDWAAIRAWAHDLPARMQGAFLFDWAEIE